MIEIFEAVHSLTGLIHLAREIREFVRECPGISALLVLLVLAGVLGAFLKSRVRPAIPPSIR